MPRLRFFDVLKGLAMFSVVNWHLMNNIGPSVHSSFIYYFLDLVQLPLFMFVAGYFCFREQDGKKYVLPKMGARTRQLLLPVVFAGLGWIMLRQYQTGEPFLPVAEILCRNGGPYYFLLCVFYLYVIYCCIALILRRFDKAVVAIVVMGAVYAVLLSLNYFSPDWLSDFLNLDPICVRFYIPFMAGVLAHRYSDRFMRLMRSKLFFAALFFIDLILIYVLNLTDIHFPFGSGFVLIQVMTISFVLLFTALCHYWEGKCNQPRLFHIFEVFGINSLVIYIVHYFFRFDLSGVAPALATTDYSSVAILIFTTPLAAIICWACLIVRDCLAASPYLELLFLGKKR